jgi:hypothetical protein
MPRPLPRKAKPTKPARFRNRKRNCTTGKSISHLVQVVKNILPAKKAAWELHILTGMGLSTCEKMLSGHRAENLDLVLALLRSDHGLKLLRAIMADSGAAWFDELEDLADIAQLKRDQLRMKRDLDRREQRLLETRAGLR